MMHKSKLKASHSYANLGHYLVASGLNEQQFAPYQKYYDEYSNMWDVIQAVRAAMIKDGYLASVLKADRIIKND